MMALNEVEANKIKQDLNDLPAATFVQRLKDAGLDQVTSVSETTVSEEFPAVTPPSPPPFPGIHCQGEGERDGCGALRARHRSACSCRVCRCDCLPLLQIPL